MVITVIITGYRKRCSRDFYLLLLFVSCYFFFALFCFILFLFFIYYQLRGIIYYASFTMNRLILFCFSVYFFIFLLLSMYQECPLLLAAIVPLFFPCSSLGVTVVMQTWDTDWNSL